MAQRSGAPQSRDPRAAPRPGNGQNALMGKNQIESVAPKVAAEIESFLGYLGAERRMSPKTLEAYRRDVLQFLSFLAGHLGDAPSLRELSALTPADVRA